MSEWEIVRHAVAIAGRVTDAQTEKTIGGAQVQITDAPQVFMTWLATRAKQYGDRWAKMVERPDRARTAADGHFHFMGLPDGEYTLNTSLPGVGSRYGTAQVEATVSRDAEGKIKMFSVEIPLPPTTLKGRVTKQNTNDPVAMAEVRIRGSGEQTFSDGDGRYLLNGLEAGERTVLLSGRGYEASSQTVLLSQGGTVELDFQLNPST